MTEYHDHRDDCPFKFATLDVCDCVEKNMLDRIEALLAENERLRHTIDAAGKLGRIMGFLGDDEALIAAFWEACGPDLVNRARATLAVVKGESHD